MGFFPVDEETLEYLKFTNRDAALIALVEAYTKEQGLFRTDETPDPQYADTLELDSSFNLLGNTNQSASQLYRYSDQTGASYNCQLSAVANVLTAFSSGCTQ